MGLMMAVLLVGLLGLGTTVTVAEPTEIDDCQEISESGEFEIVDDISQTEEEDCISITASDVTLEGQDNEISGPESDAGIAIENEEETITNVAITNVTVTGFSQGISVGGLTNPVEDATVSFVEANNNGGGISTETSTSNIELRNNTLIENDLRAIAARGDDQIVIDNLIDGNDITSTGITGGSTGSGEFSDNIIQRTDTGIDSVDHELRNNQIIEVNSVGIDMDTGQAELFNNTIDGAGVTDNGIVSVGGYISVTDSTITGTNDHGIVIGNAENGFPDPAIEATFLNTTIQETDGVGIRSEFAGENTIHFNRTKLGNTDTPFNATLNNVTVSSVDSPPELDEGMRDFDQYFEATDQNAEAFLSYTFQYEDEDVLGKHEDSVALWNHDTDWTQVDTTLDTETNTLTADIEEFSVFAPLVENNDSQLTGCRVIEEPGSYELVTDIEDDEANPCIDIQASDVEFDGLHHTIDGVEFSTDRIAILANSVDDMTLENVRTYNWGKGVDVAGENHMLDSVKVNRSASAGVSMQQAIDSTVLNLTVTSDAAFPESVGFELIGGENVTLENSEIKDLRAQEIIGLAIRDSMETKIDDVDVERISSHAMGSPVRTTGVEISNSVNTHVQESRVAEVSGISNQALDEFGWATADVSGIIVDDATNVTFAEFDVTDVSASAAEEATSLGMAVENSPELTIEGLTMNTVSASGAFGGEPDSTTHGLMMDGSDDATIQTTSLKSLAASGDEGFLVGFAVEDSSNTDLSDIHVESLSAEDFLTGIVLEDDSSGVTLDRATVEDGEESDSVGIAVGSDDSSLSETTVRSFEVGIQVDTNDLVGTETHIENTDGGLFFEAGGNEFTDVTILESELAAVSSFFGQNEVEALDLGQEGVTFDIEIDDMGLNAEDAPVQIPDSKNDIGVFLNTTIGMLEPSPELDLTVDYEPEAIELVQEDTLSMWEYGEEEAWIDRQVEPDTSAGTISDVITGEAFYAPLGNPPKVLVESVTATSVEAGATMPVDVKVEKVGGDTTEETVEFLVDANQDGSFTTVDEQSIEMADGDTETISFSYTTAAGDVPAIDIRASTGDDTMTTSASVTDPAIADFDVTITDTNSPIAPDGTLVVDAIVNNMGDATGTQTVEFAIANETDTVDDLSLAPGSSENVTFHWEPEGDHLGTHTATVSTADHVDNVSVAVESDSPEFESGHVLDADPATIHTTWDQNVFLEEATASTAGFDVEIDGQGVSLEDATASEDEVTLVLETPVEAGELVTFGYDGQSDNVVNEFGVEATAFEAIEIDNRVEAPLLANLTAIDPSLGQSSDRISIDVTVEEGVIFSAADSLVPPGEDVSYEWQIGDQTFTTTEPELTEKLLEPGTYQASVTIFAGDRSSTAEFTLEVVDETPPDVRLEALDTVEVGEDPELDASESTDNVAIAEYEWDFGDGETETGVELSTPEHAFDEPGEYEVTVTVTDTSGNSAQNSTTITVEETDEGMGVLPIGLALLALAALAVAGYWYIRRSGPS